MKLVYEKPELELLEYEVADVIAESNETDLDNILGQS